MSPLRAHMSRVSGGIGRRGAALIVFGVVFALYGVLLFMSDMAEDSPPRTVAVILAIATPQAWGTAWLGAAVLAFVQAIYGRLRSTAWAFASLSFISGVWASGYIAGWIVMEPPRDPRGWLTGGLWLAVFALTVIMSGWRDHARYSDYDVNGDGDDPS